MMCDVYGVVELFFDDFFLCDDVCVNVVVFVYFVVYE